MNEPILCGDKPGHKFRGNQYTVGQDVNINGSADGKFTGFTKGKIVNPHSNSHKVTHTDARGVQYEGANRHLPTATVEYDRSKRGLTPYRFEAYHHQLSPVTAGNSVESSDAILCRAKVQLAPTATGEMMFMPAGRHDITPFSGGIGKPIRVLIDANAAQEIEKQRQALEAKGKPAYFDFDHEDKGASFWPKQFVWRDGEGIIAKGEWTGKGKNSVEGKEYRYFSPVFYVNDKHADPALIQCRNGARANMGALINDPAFHAISPLWARDAGDGDADNNKGEQNMTPEEQAALRAKLQELEEKVEALKSKGENPDSIKAEAEKIEAQLALAAEQEKNKALGDAVKARAEADAKSAIKAAIQRGAILPKDIALQKTLIASAVADPSFLAVINAMKGDDNLTGKIVGRNITITAEDPSRVYRKMSEICAKQGSVRGSLGRQHEERGKISCEFASIFAAEFKGANAGRLLDMPLFALREELMAADVTDSDFGTLAGTLVTQRILERLEFSFPALTSFTTDFSGEGATYGQTVMTRTVADPTVVTYNTSTGWAASDPQTTDVPVAIDSHKGVNIVINEQTLASTMRRLFEEQAEPSAYALGKAVCDDLYSHITDANFTNNTVATVTGLDRAKLIDVGVALDLRGVPNYPGARTALLYPTFFGNLQKDSAIISLAAFQKAGLITEPQGNPGYMIDVAGFKVYSAPNLPTNDGNVNGFAGSKSALVIVTRVPNDYTTVLPGANNGSVQTVTNPNIGISVMLVQYVNHTLGTANRRVALMWGTDVGQGAAGQLIKSNTGSGSSH